jgi:hypothetical protein
MANIPSTYSVIMDAAVYLVGPVVESRVGITHRSPQVARAKGEGHRLINRTSVSFMRGCVSPDDGVGGKTPSTFSATRT